MVAPRGTPISEKWSFSFALHFYSICSPVHLHVFAKDCSTDGAQKHLCVWNYIWLPGACFIGAADVHEWSIWCTELYMAVKDSLSPSTLVHHQHNQCTCTVPLLQPFHCSVTATEATVVLNLYCDSTAFASVCWLAQRQSTVFFSFFLWGPGQSPTIAINTCSEFSAL